MFKNVASKLVVYAFDSTTSLPITGDAANITAYVDKDFAGVNVLADTSAAEIDATNAAGYYQFDLAQAETNADALLFSAKSSTANIVVIGVPAMVFTFPTTGILAPTVAARTLDVSATGEAGVDWANVGSPTTTVELTGTTVVPILTGEVGSSPWNTTTVGDALKAAWSQGVGKWAISGTTLNIYAPDGTTVLKAFTLDSAAAPTSRT